MALGLPPCFFVLKHLREHQPLRPRDCPRARCPTRRQCRTHQAWINKVRVLTRVRRETGKRRGCKSLTMKGRANHIGPESCVVCREVRVEALTGVPAGQVLSRERKSVRDADTVRVVEGSMVGCVIASAPPVPRGLRPWHAGETSCLGTGRSHVWPPREGRSALGRPEGRSQ